MKCQNLVIINKYKSLNDIQNEELPVEVHPLASGITFVLLLPIRSRSLSLSRSYTHLPNVLQGILG
jgi:hypothetical protein